MALSARALREMGIRENPEEVERMVLEAMRRITSGLPPSDPRRSLTPSQKDALRRGGFDPEPREYGREHPTLKAATEYAALIASSLTVQQAAQKLGVDGSRIRQRLLARSLYGIRLRDGWRIPSFQFDGDRLLPGLGDVIGKLPSGLHPLAVANWFLTPNPDLTMGDDETSLSPRDWLRAGMDAGQVADLASDLTIAT